MDEFAQSLRRLITVMTRYSDDIEAVLVQVPPERRSELRLWLRASSRGNEALRKAAEFLRQLPGRPSPSVGRTGHRASDPATRGIAEAGAALTTGRDLLHTHLAVTPAGYTQGRSEWARVVTSVPVARAMLFEVASCARQVALVGGQLATAPLPVHGSAEARRRVNAACQWLWVLDWTVQAAHGHDPLRVGDQRLLRAIPVNAIEPRQHPTGTGSVSRLCEGTISTAERVRRIARMEVPAAAWSPSLTAASLRETASCATVISHNCQVVLGTLARRVGEGGPAELAEQLAKAADAAGAARQAWIDAARQWRSITTDARGPMTRVDAETRDLALWTGRLAYDDPAWTPQQGPSRAIRRPEHLAAGPEDLVGVVAAVHHACETLAQLADAEHERVATAGQAGRLLVLTRSLPDGFDVPHRYAPAPDFRVEPLLRAYRSSGTASVDMASAVGAVAAAVRAPSRCLTAARAVARAHDKDLHASGMELGADTQVQRQVPREMPGPVERIMHELGVASPELLNRAMEVDQEGEKLVREAAAQQGSAESDRSMSWNPSRSVGTAELINHLLPSAGDLNAAAGLLPMPQRAIQPEIEP
ncbi:MAG: hypothetical protein ACYCVZ_01730 [Streptosporangiaceae bacterium]